MHEQSKILMETFSNFFKNRKNKKRADFLTPSARGSNMTNFSELPKNLKRDVKTFWAQYMEKIQNRYNYEKNLKNRGK